MMKTESYAKMPKNTPMEMIEKVQRFIASLITERQIEISKAETLTIAICKLLNIFDSLKLKDRVKSSSNKNFNIISLGCGDAIECVALTLYFDETFGKENYSLNYVGVDIDQDRIDSAIQLFSSNKTNFVRCDGSDKQQLHKKLITDNLLPEKGFDLVILRQPHILSEQYGSVFEKMLTDVVPYIASEESNLLVTVFRKNELDHVKKCLDLDHSQTYFTNVPIFNEKQYKKGVGQNMIYSNSSNPMERMLLEISSFKKLKEQRKKSLFSHDIDSSSKAYNFFSHPSFVYKKSRFDSFAEIYGCHGQTFLERAIPSKSPIKG